MDSEELIYADEWRNMSGLAVGISFLDPSRLCVYARLGSNVLVKAAISKNETPLGTANSQIAREWT